MKLVLDSGVLSRLCHPSAEQSKPAFARIKELHAAHGSVVVYVPEIVDFEVRRKLLHMKSAGAVVRLDNLHAVFTYIKINTPIMRAAAELWAKARLRGQATAGETSLDADVVLAAQALSVGGTVATTNSKHLAQFVAVQDWS